MRVFLGGLGVRHPFFSHAKDAKAAKFQQSFRKPAAADSGRATRINSGGQPIQYSESFCSWVFAFFHG